MGRGAETRQKEGQGEARRTLRMQREREKGEGMRERVNLVVYIVQLGIKKG